MTPDPDPRDGHQVMAPMAATVAAVRVASGDLVQAGQPLVVLEVMKMEHPLTAPTRARVETVAVGEGDTVDAGQVLVFLVASPDAASAAEESPVPAGAPDGPRTDLAELTRRRALLADDARPEAVAKRHGRGQRTARENVADLVDTGSFHEYGGFAFAAQESRRDREELQARTPADGLITGLGRINGALVGEDRAACAVVAYDYTVLAGTQGHRNHAKKDRMFELAERMRLPVVLFAEGGGGRPGDTDMPIVAGLDTRAFELFARLSGLVPTVGIAAGRCFAGNAALLGCCDVVIATADSNIGMGGPAMIEGGGLGVVGPEDIGPIDIQVANGVVDVAVADEVEAVAVAKRYLSFFQGPVADWAAPDQERLRTLVPERRKQVYDVRAVVHGLADVDSVLELRRGFGAGMVTALVRLEGEPVGVLANDPAHLGGAIDTDAADKAARFLQLCDAHRIPMLYLCDTPGFMVGPDAERTAQVRHFSRMFVTAASMTVPFGTVVLRKGYGLGAQSMAGGSFKAGLFTLSWPTGEFGGMGLEGAVKLGFRRELEAIEDPEDRQEAFDHMVAAAYRHGQALNMAAHLEIDDVIDPAETRARVLAAFRADRGERRGRPAIDTW
ncbi:MAG: biotin carboxylase [Acidimicrobiales bacterium]|nr:biotin carboxylase [Acidimicrobiales bacterium]HMS88145.1 carboxyl transferase domain-containing protein [Acidimicrobiales bacterium]